MQKVDVLLSCGHILNVEIEAAIFAPKEGDKLNCEKHGEQKVLKVSVPYHIESKISISPGQTSIDDKET